jgi:hypothetical protein
MGRHTTCCEQLRGIELHFVEGLKACPEEPPAPPLGEREKVPMTTSDWIIGLNGIAIILAPIVALWVGGILQRRSDSHKSKLTLFGTLIALRHDPLSVESTRALNLIDAVFADDPAVREAWTRYYTALNDPNMNSGSGFSLREERRRDLLLEMVKAPKLTRKISSADLLRTYLPTFIAETTHVAWLERIQKKAFLEEDLTRRHIPFPPSPVPQQPTLSPTPQPTTGNGAQQPQ